MGLSKQMDSAEDLLAGPSTMSHLFSSSDKLISIAKSTSFLRTAISRTRRYCSWKVYLSCSELVVLFIFLCSVYFRLNCQIDGDVYDVSSGSAYQPGGSYHIL
jgi:hypothetical protein